ncbi:MAG: alpha/beta hydrolase [Thermoleophilaceae bacterium]
MLEPQTQRLLAEVAGKRLPKIWEMSPQELRATFDAFFAEHGLPPADLVDREDVEIPGPATPIRARIYRPRDTPSGPRPGLLYLHGGGMVCNSVDTYDALVQHLCAGSGCVVVSSDYRLAPEHPFPAGLDDAYSAACWMHEHAARLGADPERLAVGGDSAGGYLTAAITQIARDAGAPPLVFQMLIYPAVGTRGVSRSLVANASGYLFERDELDWIYSVYLADPRDSLDPRACPILQPDFAGLPPAFVLTAEYDILRDDGEDYAHLLEQAGVPVEVHRYEGTIHPFLNLAGSIDLGRQAIEECAAKLREGVALEHEAARSR